MSMSPGSSLLAQWWPSSWECGYLQRRSNDDEMIAVYAQMSCLRITGNHADMEKGNDWLEHAARMQRE